MNEMKSYCWCEELHNPILSNRVKEVKRLLDAYTFDLDRPVWAGAYEGATPLQFAVANSADGVTFACSPSIIWMLIQNCATPDLESFKNIVSYARIERDYKAGLDSCEGDACRHTPRRKQWAKFIERIKKACPEVVTEFFMTEGVSTSGVTT